MSLCVYDLTAAAVSARAAVHERYDHICFVCFQDLWRAGVAVKLAPRIGCRSSGVIVDRAHRWLQRYIRM